MTDHAAKTLNIRLEGRKKKQFLRNVAGYLYHSITSAAGFPYDEDESRSRDRRKIFGSPFHLVDRGAAFVGSDKVLGPNYQGEVPMTRENVIQIRFSNPKIAGENATVYTSSGGRKVFDYAEYVLDKSGDGMLRGIGGFDLESEIDNAVEHGLDRFWSRL